MIDDKLAYIIMPVSSDPLYRVRRAAIERGLRACGLQPLFPSYGAEKLPFRLADFKATLARVEIVLADLSLQRPSCYFEVGVAETLGKEMALIAEAGTPIHQCAGRNDVRFYREIADIPQLMSQFMRAPTH